MSCRQITTHSAQTPEYEFSNLCHNHVIHKLYGGAKRPKFTDPKTGRIFSGAGVLMIQDCNYQGKKTPCALLFYDSYKGAYEDLGGGWERKHHNLETTAMVEAQEESHNLLNIMNSGNFYSYIDRQPLPRLAPNLYFRIYMIRVSGFDTQLYYHNQRLIKKAVKKMNKNKTLSKNKNKPPKGWLETTKVAKVPLINLFQTGVSKNNFTYDINGNRIRLSRTRMYLDHQSILQMIDASKSPIKKLRPSIYRGEESFLKKTITYYLN